MGGTAAASAQLIFGAQMEVATPPTQPAGRPQDTLPPSVGRIPKRLRGPEGRVYSVEDLIAGRSRPGGVHRLEGVGGSAKSEITNEFAELLEARGCVVLRLRGRRYEAVPAPRVAVEDELARAASRELLGPRSPLNDAEQEHLRQVLQWLTRFRSGDDEGRFFQLPYPSVYAIGTRSVPRARAHVTAVIEHINEMLAVKGLGLGLVIDDVDLFHDRSFTAIEEAIRRQKDALPWEAFRDLSAPPEPLQYAVLVTGGVGSNSRFGAEAGSELDVTIDLPTYEDMRDSLRVRVQAQGSIILPEAEDVVLRSANGNLRRLSQLTEMLRDRAERVIDFQAASLVAEELYHRSKPDYDVEWGQLTVGQMELLEVIASSDAGGIAARTEKNEDHWPYVAGGQPLGDSRRKALSKAFDSLNGTILREVDGRIDFANPDQKRHVREQAAIPSPAQRALRAWIDFDTDLLGWVQANGPSGEVNPAHVEILNQDANARRRIQALATAGLLRIEDNGTEGLRLKLAGADVVGRAADVVVPGPALLDFHQEEMDLLTWVAKAGPHGAVFPRSEEDLRRPDYDRVRWDLRQLREMGLLEIASYRAYGTDWQFTYRVRDPEVRAELLRRAGRLPAPAQSHALMELPFKGSWLFVAAPSEADADFAATRFREQTERTGAIAINVGTNGGSTYAWRSALYASVMEAMPELERRLGRLPELRTLLDEMEGRQHPAVNVRAGLKVYDAGGGFVIGQELSRPDRVLAGPEDVLTLLDNKLRAYNRAHKTELRVALTVGSWDREDQAGEVTSRLQDPSQEITDLPRIVPSLEFLKVLVHMGPKGERLLQQKTKSSLDGLPHVRLGLVPRDDLLARLRDCMDRGEVRWGSAIGRFQPRRIAAAAAEAIVDAAFGSPKALDEIIRRLVLDDDGYQRGRGDVTVEDAVRAIDAHYVKDKASQLRRRYAETELLHGGEERLKDFKAEWLWAAANHRFLRRPGGLERDDAKNWVTFCESLKRWGLARQAGMEIEVHPLLARFLRAELSSHLPPSERTAMSPYLDSFRFLYPQQRNLLLDLARRGTHVGSDPRVVDSLDRAGMVVKEELAGGAYSADLTPAAREALIYAPGACSPETPWAPLTADSARTAVADDSPASPSRGDRGEPQPPSEPSKLIGYG